MITSNALTIDLDGVRHYHAIHGLPPPRTHGANGRPNGAGLGADDDAHDPALDVGVPRFLALCDELGMRSTIFVVGHDLEREAFARTIRDAHAAGHEIASHSFAHAYDLSRRARDDIERDVSMGADAIERVIGKRPSGFRAPGYNVSDALFEALHRAGFTYDSSVMRSPFYFAARALAIGWKRVRGMHSQSIVGDARQWMLPHSNSRRHGIVELPITTLFGLPFTGQTIALAPLDAISAIGARALRPCILELHAIDFCDEHDGFDRALVAVQPELRVPWAKKRERIRDVLLALRHVRTLDAIAASRAP